MGWKITKTKLNKFNIYTTISDGYIAKNITREQVKEIYKNRALERAEDEIETWLLEIEHGPQASWDYRKKKLDKLFKDKKKS
jgi:hypothetical protein